MANDDSEQTGADVTSDTAAAAAGATFGAISLLWSLLVAASIIVLDRIKDFVAAKWGQVYVRSPSNSPEPLDVREAGPFMVPSPPETSTFRDGPAALTRSRLRWEGLAGDA